MTDKVRGTLGITITVIEYDAATDTYETVKSATFAPAENVDSVSPVRPFVVASLPVLGPGPGARRRPEDSEGDR